MTRVLAEEEAHREHVVVYLSGAHAYGFPSPDSDLDLKAIHVAKTADLLGFEVAGAHRRPRGGHRRRRDRLHVERARPRALRHPRRQRQLHRARARPHGRAARLRLLAELRPLVQRSLSRRVHRHYRGFALNQLRFLEKEPTAKKLLYVLAHDADGNPPARDRRARGRPHAADGPIRALRCSIRHRTKARWRARRARCCTVLRSGARVSMPC